MELKNMPCFGVAGNFTGHLEQAGEAKDFLNFKTKDANAPKAVFPTYIPVSKPEFTPKFLSVFPFDSKKIIFPKDENKLQIEPECAIICNLTWEKELIKRITPVSFGASNDCSIRKEGAKKISEKKNWGKCSKGLSDNLIPLDSFNSCSIINDYCIASFLIRDGKIYEYGQNSLILNYSYIYEKLLFWLVDKLNNQSDEGPAENIHKYLLEAGKPESAMISIGATRYTKWGEQNFLMNNDKTCIILYPQSKYSQADILKIVEKEDFKDPEISVLFQTVQM